MSTEDRTRARRADDGGGRGSEQRRRREPTGTAGNPRREPAPNPQREPAPNREATANPRRDATTNQRRDAPANQRREPGGRRPAARSGPPQLRPVSPVKTEELSPFNRQFCHLNPQIHNETRA